MKQIIIIWIVALLLISSVTADQITKYKDDKSYIEDKGIFLESPYKIYSGEKAVIKFTNKMVKSNYHLCYRFTKSLNYFDFGRKDQIKKENNIVCFSEINVYDDQDINITLSYHGYGETKYDIILIPQKHGMDFKKAGDDMIILDPIVVGTPGLKFTFNPKDGTYNHTFAEETVGSKDAVVNNNNFRKGYFGSAYDFDGTNDYLKTISMNYTYPSFTHSFMLYPDDLSSSYVFSLYNFSNRNEYYVTMSSNKINFYYWGNKVGGCYYALAVPYTASGSWTHIISTFNGTNISVYFDGIKQTGTYSSFSPPCTYSMDNRKLVIGATQALAQPFDGEIDEVLFYDGTITDAQATQLYDLYNLTTLSLSFYDEKTNALIENVNVTETHAGTSGTHSTNTGSVYIGVVNETEYKFTYYSGTEYTSRSNYYDVVAGRNSVNLYLVSYVDQVYTTYHVLDGYDNNLANVTITVYKNIGGSDVQVSKSYTDSAGISVFLLDASVTYSVKFQKTGYATQILSLVPSTETITVYMESGDEVFTQPYVAGIGYDYLPESTSLNNNTKYNFSINMSSQYWNITLCNMSILNGSTVVSYIDATFNNIECNATIEFDTNGYDLLTAVMYYEVSHLLNSSVAVDYNIEYTYQGEFSLKTFIDDVNSFIGYGFDNFGRMLLSLMVVIIVVAWVSEQSDTLANTEPQIIIALSIIFALSYNGWLTLTYSQMPNIPLLKQYFVFALCLLAGGAYLMSNQNK